MEEKTLYQPSEDSYFAKPYIDVEEWRDTPVRHYFVHGGFQGTDIDGKNECRFCFYFPDKDKYENRFFQYLSPAPENEHSSENLEGEDDKISFALTHGAYYVSSNQGGFIPGGDPSRLYKTSANTAEYSRKVALRIYETDKRPYGYVFGGSGGSFKTMSCIEMTEGIWDGAAPYILANPMATPNVFAPRCRAMRVLGEEGIARVIDNMSPGGSGNLYDGLSEEQKEVLAETTRMGFPKRGWFLGKTMGDGSLMVLAPFLYQVCPQYFTDFWTKDGYAGADPNSSEAKARVQFVTKVSRLLLPETRETRKNYNADNSWWSTLTDNSKTPQIVPEELPSEEAYLVHCRLKVLSGAAKGRECVIDTIRNGVISIHRAGEGAATDNVLQGIAVGDEIMIDNSDYLAMQTLQRHQIPDETYEVYDQYRSEDGSTKYPQLPFLIAPLIAQNAGGSVPTGNIHGKVMVNCSVLDESAFAWHGDWYRKAVQRHLGEQIDEQFRLYYNDNCTHMDSVRELAEPQYEIDYLGMLHQTMMDLVNWCENGVAPAAGTTYKVEDGQVIVPETAEERGGLQPVVHAYVDGEKAVKVRTGQEVSFTAEITAPVGGGMITEAAWDFERTNDFSQLEELERTENGKKAKVHSVHTFSVPGTYFPVIRVKSQRDGSGEDIFTQCKNLDRVRVIVE
ncbi:MAG: hypothetical protein Q4B22_05025 [Eubacteriales bacterium]|nr:hypothetical protein [Eubacteriales bacterium]